MSITTLLHRLLKGLHDEMADTLKDLTAEQVNWRPAPKANSIGFTLWHALRVWDWDHFRMRAGDELYEMEGWPARFGFETKGKGLWGAGFGTDFTAEDVAAMPMPPEVLSAYLEALWARTETYLDSAGDETLAVEAPHPRRPGVMLTAAMVLSHTVAHTFMHIGEAQYVKGLLDV
ncbi:MAG: DinB family protein [Chloroflexi bacterium]|nr:DinB family protein [Chloroflexota bacterium]